MFIKQGGVAGETKAVLRAVSIDMENIQIQMLYAATSAKCMVSRLCGGTANAAAAFSGLYTPVAHSPNLRRRRCVAAEQQSRKPASGGSENQRAADSAGADEFVEVAALRSKLLTRKPEHGEPSGGGVCAAE